MKTSTKKQDNCIVELTVELDAAERQAVVKEVEKVFMREARMPGFRPGKIPLELVRKNFADGIAAETKQRAIAKNADEAIKAEKLDAVNIVGAKSVEYSGDGMTFTILVETKPVFKLPTYKGLKIAKADISVSDKDVEGRLEELRAAYSTYEDGKEGDKVEEGDMVQIDYSGTVDGKPISEIEPEAKIVAGMQGFWLQVQDGRFLPEILKAIKGLKAGESKKGVKAAFDNAEVTPPALVGKKALYDVAVKMIRKRVKPDDAVFAEKAKAASVDELRGKIRKSMEEQAVKREAARRENDATEMLLKKSNFDVPLSQVESVKASMLERMGVTRDMMDVSNDAPDVRKAKEQLFGEAAKSAEKQVRLWYIIDAIAKAENIEASENEPVGAKVVEFILANSK